MPLGSAGKKFKNCFSSSSSSPGRMVACEGWVRAEVVQLLQGLWPNLGPAYICGGWVMTGLAQPCPLIAQVTSCSFAFWDAPSDLFILMAFSPILSTF